MGDGGVPGHEEGAVPAEGRLRDWPQHRSHNAQKAFVELGGRARGQLIEADQPEGRGRRRARQRKRCDGRRSAEENEPEKKGKRSCLPTLWPTLIWIYECRLSRFQLRRLRLRYRRG